MDKYSLYVSNFLPCKEYFTPEKNISCPGCGLALAVRQVYKSLDKEIERATWRSLSDVDEVNNPSLLGGQGIVVSFLNIPKSTKTNLIICFDNESGGSLDEVLEKPMPSIAVAANFSYVATACPSYPFDLYDKVKRGLQTEGNTFIYVLCPCPAGWHFDPDLTVKVGRWAVESRTFPLYEAGDGVYNITVETPYPRAVSEYLKIQQRFAKLSAQEIKRAEDNVAVSYKRLQNAVQGYLNRTG